MNLPRYRCHKEVNAAKICAVRRIEEPRFTTAVCRGAVAFGSACGHCARCIWNRERGPQSNAALLILDGEGSTSEVSVSNAYLAKHNPAVRGYFVVYEDGYQSFSPAAAFEAGYTRV